MQDDPFTNPVSRLIWETKYRRRGVDRHVRDTWRRVARAIAAVEPDPATWSARFSRLLDDFGYLPGGRILAGAGVDREVTLFNCFVMGV
ncbi:MAG: ribonucleoside-diphosphate reductase, adenosylcobalamin-dependent, partial [Gammaproteobacteria bacterium]